MRSLIPLNSQKTLLLLCVCVQSDGGLSGIIIYGESFFCWERKKATFFLLRASADGSKKSRSFSRKANFFPSCHFIVLGFSNLILIIIVINSCRKMLFSLCSQKRKLFHFTPPPPLPFPFRERIRESEEKLQKFFNSISFFLRRGQ